MKQPKISIIVPIYNVEKYLDECMLSLLNQTLKDIEIILINDGSTDNSDKIVKKYKDERIIYISKNNEGIGKTRNKGIDIATTLNDNNPLPSQVDMEKNQIEREKIAASKEQAQLGFINSSLDRAQRDRSDASKERIAAKNKNRYDK